MEITKGKIPKAQKIVIYGPEGIGKSTFAAQFPEPLFIDTEDSTLHMDVSRTNKPSSWTMLLEQVRYVKIYPNICKTLVIDTADWAEKLCVAEVCSKAQKSSIEEFGYGKGYIYLSEEFGRLLNLLTDVINVGINVVITAHAKMRKFEEPNEMGSYDRWELKLEKQTAPLLKEWADMVLFANYKVNVVNVDGQGALKGKNKAQGGKRVMYTTHSPSWDAKNRASLPDMLDFDFVKIAHCLPNLVLKDLAKAVEVVPDTSTPPAPMEKPVEKVTETVSTDKQMSLTEKPKAAPYTLPKDIPKALADLMQENLVTEKEIQEACAYKGYYPADTPIANYSTDFINGALVGAWEQVFSIIMYQRDIPFE